MDLEELQKHWHEFGKKDPMWAILTVPEKKNRHWDAEEFFQNGKNEIAEVMAYVDALGLSLMNRKALDFGCGVGRLTQALADHFDESCGVDIAPSMIEAARKYNRHGERCRYFTNEKDDLSLFADDSFDFIYTVIVLQHMQPEYSRRYIVEFLRILAPGGVLVFQIPSELAPKETLPRPLAPAKPSPAWLRPFLSRYFKIKQRIASLINSRRFIPKMEMHAIPKDQVLNLVTSNGGKVVDIVQDQWAGPAWISYRYCIQKKPSS